MPDYYNFQHSLGNDFWFRRSFLTHLWSAYKNDPHWSPPEYQVMRATVMAPHPHIARHMPVFIHSHAIRRQQQSHTKEEAWFGRDPIFMVPIQEETVGLGVALHDPRRNDQAACLAFLRIANQPECLEQVLNSLLEVSNSYGFQRIIGPVEFSHHLEGGLLVDHWRESPPQYTSYNPPFLIRVSESFCVVRKPRPTLYGRNGIEHHGASQNQPALSSSGPRKAD